VLRGMHCSHSVSPADDVSKWCHYVKHTPEPDLLFYNRIPKSGSSTMLDILMHNQLNISNMLDLINTNNTYWKFHDTPEKSKQLYDLVRLSYRPGKKILLSGHVPYFPFNMSSVTGTSNARMEYINTLRNCSERFVSNFIYSALDCAAAKQAKHNKKIPEYNMHNFGATNITACILNNTCLHQSPLFQNLFPDVVSHFILGEDNRHFQYSKQKQNVAELNTIMEPREGNLIAFGLAEHFEESLELLECVYPTFFHGNIFIALNIFIVK
jgi:hypothetical protein